MKKSYIAPALILVSTTLFGCSNSNTSEVAKTGNTSQTATASNSIVNQTPMTGNNNPAAASSLSNTAPVAVPTSTNATGNSSSPSVNKNTKSSPSTNEPVAQIGSGAGDLVLFTQVRSALDADQELTKKVIVEIKEGNVVLNGSVSSEAQKMKATNLAQSINGIKSVKNNLRVAS